MTVRIDMAKRIMHSILPYIADPKQVDSTKGVVDYTSLSAAVEGRYDIIKYGSKCCVKELKHYHPEEVKSKFGVKDKTDLFNESDAHIREQRYEQAVETCIVAFGDSNNGWDSKYGGPPWQKIAETVRNIIKLDNALKQIEKNKKDPNYINIKNLVLNYLVIELNVFDGLSHNTASIMNNVLSEEAHSGVGTNSANELNKVMNMRDATELENPISVFEAVEESLKSTGDIHRWKDWTPKLRAHPSYRNVEYKGQLARIKIRKLIICYIRSLDKHMNDLHSLMEVVNSKEIFDKDNLPSELRSLRSICNSMKDIVNEVSSVIERCFNSDDPETPLTISPLKMKITEFYKCFMFYRDKTSKQDFISAYEEINKIIEFIRLI